MAMRVLILSLLLSIKFVALAGETLTVEDYWQLTKVRLELAAIEWQERIASAYKANGDRRVLISSSETITKQFAEYHRTLHSKFGTDQQGYLHFANNHPREVESYLESEPHSDLKREIGQLRERIQDLMHRYDALAEPILREVK